MELGTDSADASVAEPNMFIGGPPGGALLRVVDCDEGPNSEPDTDSDYVD